jgi:hypothetical protein
MNGTDALIQTIAWTYAVHRWRLSPCQGRTLNRLSQAQQHEAKSAARDIVAAIDATGTHRVVPMKAKEAMCFASPDEVLAAMLAAAPKVTG